MGEMQKIVVVGAGPVGSLAALYAATRGHDVEIYELRGDLRDPSTALLGFTRSINLALSERGINAMRISGRPALLDEALAGSLPMRGRMIHGRRPDAELYEASQDYDVHGRCIRAIDRGGLNKTLLDSLEEMPNVRFFFHHKLVGADFRKAKAWFDVNKDDEKKEVEIDFDVMIGADGAHSAVRYHMMKYARMDYSQEYIDALWCEFQIQARDVWSKEDPNSQFRISPNHLHIWPGREFMFIAIPSEDGTFTCTFFGPAHVYDALEADENGQYIPAFFDEHFPGVTALIPPAELVAQFRRNPHLPLISIKCKPHHFSSTAVIVGDAAHAMVPFYGQGMNAGLEDVRVLFSFLDKFPAAQRAQALDEYTAVRAPDAHSINDLALQNYVEMRASVLSPTYRLRKFLEESLSKYLPGLGWQTKYSRVSFSSERYSEIIARSERQGTILLRAFATSVGLPVVVGGCFLYLRFKRVIDTGVMGAVTYLAGLAQR